MGLPVDVPSEVPPAMADRIEHHVRRLGIPLAAVEAVADSLDAAEGFLHACEAGRGRAYAASARDDGPSEDDAGTAAQDPVHRVRLVKNPAGVGRRRDGSDSTAARQA